MLKAEFFTILLYYSTEVALLKLYPVLRLQCDPFYLITEEVILQKSGSQF